MLWKDSESSRLTAEAGLLLTQVGVWKETRLQVKLRRFWPQCHQCKCSHLIFWLTYKMVNTRYLLDYLFRLIFKVAFKISGTFVLHVSAQRNCLGRSKPEQRFNFFIVRPTGFAFCLPLYCLYPDWWHFRCSSSFCCIKNMCWVYFNLRTYNGCKAKKRNHWTISLYSRSTKSRGGGNGKRSTIGTSKQTRASETLLVGFAAIMDGAKWCLTCDVTERCSVEWRRSCSVTEPFEKWFSEGEYLF